MWVSSAFDPLLQNFHPLFTENIQYSQGFAVIHPMNMHFYASIYDFRFPNFSRINFLLFLYFFAVFVPLFELIRPFYNLRPVRSAPENRQKCGKRGIPCRFVLDGESLFNSHTLYHIYIVITRPSLIAPFYLLD